MCLQWIEPISTLTVLTRPVPASSTRWRRQKNLFVFGSDVCNAFAEAPPPEQGFYIRPNRVFNKWWVNYKGNPPIPPGHIIPVLLAMQGHPESPRLWEKHADAILHDLGLTPMVHEPCLYSGVINGKRIVFMRQVNDFAIAASDL